MEMVTKKRISMPIPIELIQTLKPEPQDDTDEVVESSAQVSKISKTEKSPMNVQEMSHKTSTHREDNQKVPITVVTPVGYESSSASAVSFVSDKSGPSPLPK